MNECPICGEEMELIDIKRDGITWTRTFKHICKEKDKLNEG